MPKDGHSPAERASQVGQTDMAEPADTMAVPVPMPARRPIPWRVVVTQALGSWLATRVAFVVLTYCYEAFFVPGSTTAPLLVADWDKWDAIWYVTIAHQGYWTQQATAFFPLYPLLIRGTSVLLGGRYIAAALLVSNLAALAGLIGLGALTASEAWGPRAPWRAMLVLLAYPMAFFLFAPYTESLFLAAAIFCLLAARRGSWGWAAACALLATATRPTGVALLLPLLWEYGRQHGWWAWPIWRPSWWQARFKSHHFQGSSGGTSAVVAGSDSGSDWHHFLRKQAPIVLVGALVCGTIPLVFALLMLYAGYRFGHPLLIFNIHRSGFERVNVPIWDSLAVMIHNALTLPLATIDQAHILVVLGALATVTMVAIASLKKIPYAFTLYTAGVIYFAVSTAIPTSPVPLTATARFLLVAFPVFMVVGKATERHHWLEVLLVSTGFMLQALFAVLFLSHVLIE